jgi:hypothetical protein
MQIGETVTRDCGGFEAVKIGATQTLEGREFIT